MTTDRGDFEVREPSGKVYRVWADGRIEGFEAGSIVFNRIPLLLHSDLWGPDLSNMEKARQGEYPTT